MGCVSRTTRANDIAADLRHRVTMLGPGAEPCYTPEDLELFERAADEIERLRARVRYEVQQRMALTARLEELDPPPAGSDAT